ncbi:cAMP-mediated signaling protein sok1 [Coemansia aciculifera]|uniref:cAMP-mediated signaling protein sok1 n=1 Tax=Coemansia aciculifera TaxID=417176 RepID=A0ACC1MAF7_9FUNG|nr:cAMP-mediated signaling protein sok1 [Coemansia aciculifera]
MSESYTTQDSDYLSAAHHTQPTSAAGRGDSPGSAAAAAAVATHDFLSSALSTSRDSSNDGPSAPVSNSGNVAVASRADLINASVGSMSPPTMAPSVVSDASCAGATSPTSAAPSSLGQTQMVSFQHQAMAGSSAMAAAATTVSNGAQRSVGLCEPGSVALTHSVHAVCRGTKRRGSDSSIILMAVGSGDSNEHSQSAYSAQTSGTIAAVCPLSPTTSSRKRRSLDSSPPNSPASHSVYSSLRRSPSLSLSPSSFPATLARPICGGSADNNNILGSASGGSSCKAPPTSSPSERTLPLHSSRRLVLVPHHNAVASALARSADPSGNLRRTHIDDGLSAPRDSDCTSSPESLARAISNGGINSLAQQVPTAAHAIDRRAPPPCSAAATTASSAKRTLPARLTRSSDSAQRAVSAPSQAGDLAQRPIVPSSPAAFSECTTRQRSTITAGTAAANAASASVSAPALVATSASRAHRQAELQPRHQQQHQQLAPKPSAPATVPVVAKPQVCTLPPINRYTLRELKIQNILQNPRLRHEVLFEPKLEFRPNLVGHLAEAKQRAAVHYWTAVDHGLRKNNSAAVSTLTMLLVELREILAEMAEDSPRAELSCHATELRERLDEERLRQQIAHGVFDAEPVVRYLASVMRLFAQAAAAQRESGVVHDAAINRVLAYVQRGRVVRALRAAFDVMEAIKIDTANGSIEMYREYMRSTAVSFERSHFNLALQRSSLSLSDTTEWWRRVLEGGCGSGDVTPSSATATFAATSGASLDIVFAEAARELILDEGQSIPGLFRMDEGRIQGIRREAERLAIVGMVFLAFSQFLQLVASRSAAGGAAVAPVVGEFKNANGRVEYERLAAECLLIVPEGCAVKWTELLIAAPATTKSATAAAPNAMDGGVLPGEVGFSHLVSELVLLAERVLGRIVTCAEVAMLERTLLRTARYECPLREVVEERVNGAVRLHTAALTELSGKVAGTECEAMPQAAKDMLRRSMLLFLAPSLSTLSMRIHAVVSHHWMVYKALYASILSSTMPLSAATTTATTTSNPPSPPLQPFPSLSPL